MSTVFRENKKIAKRKYLTMRPYNNDIYTYSTRIVNDFTTVGELTPIPGLTAVSCPKNRTLIETGRKLYPGVNPGITKLHVSVFDATSGLNGFIDPTSASYFVLDSDTPYFVSTPDVNSLDPATRDALSIQNATLWSQQYTMYTVTDGAPSSLFADNYEKLRTVYSQYPELSTDVYPELNEEYYLWLLSGTFPENSSIVSTSDPGYTVPVITATTSATETPAQNSTTVVTGATFVSNTEYITAGTSGFTNTIKEALETPSGNWYTTGNKTANGVILAQYTVTSQTFTISNTRFRNVYFNIPTTNMTLTFVGNNIVFENCVFDIPRNEGDGILYFDVRGAGSGVVVQNCVFRNVNNTVNRVEFIGTRGLIAGSSIVIQNNWDTLNFSSATSGNGYSRIDFNIPSSITSDILGDIYIVNNNFDNMGFANGNAYTDGSPKGFFSVNYSTARTYTFRAYIDNNTFEDTTVANDHAVVAIGGTIPASFIGTGFFYIKDTTIPNTYKKIMVYARQTDGTYSSPIFYLPA